MAEPLKNMLAPPVIQAMSENLARVSGDFDRDRFLKVALDDLDELELSQRSDQIVTALEQAYSTGFEETVAALLKALHPVSDAELPDMEMDATGIAGWAVTPLAAYVARHGIDKPELSLAALREMTMRASSEFSVRPFFREHTKLTLKTALKWAGDPNVHVRRLASEGSRPRLPWGIKLNAFVDDPALILPILTALRDDSSEYVRRSVANSLNDIAKDHPDLVSELAADWMKAGDPNRKRLVKHACRTLVKDGHAGAMAVFGFPPPQLQNCSVSLSSEAVQLGDTLDIGLDLTGSDKPQKLLIDYVMHFMRANGKLSAKVFKWTEMTLDAGETVSLTKSHSYRKVTTRKDYPGTQHVSVRINGQDFDGPSYEFTL